MEPKWVRTINSFVTTCTCYVCYDLHMDDKTCYWGVAGHIIVVADSIWKKLSRWIVRWQIAIWVYYFSRKTMVNSFLFVMGFANMSVWLDRADQVVEIRQLLSRYSQFNTTLWDRNSGYFDLSFVAKKLTFAGIYITMLCMLVICLLFVPNISCVLVAISAIGSICFSKLYISCNW